MESTKIIYTKVDEAPALATYSLLPILQGFIKGSGIEFVSWDISLAGRIIANFPENLTEEQKAPDYLDMLGKLAKTPGANIVKLPNISATIPQLQAAIKELQEKGYEIPDYPENSRTNEEKEIQDRFAKVLGSAVNPVLREGNSDRRATDSVKNFGRKNPHKMMKAWPEMSKSRVAHMNEKDFYGNEKSITINEATDVSIVFHGEEGTEQILKKSISLLPGEIIDTSAMNVAALRQFFEETMNFAEQDGVLLSLHMKATMMKVSDPIIFGHCVSVYYKDVFAKHAELFVNLGINPNNGIGDVYARLDALSAKQKQEIEEDIMAVYSERPELAIVNSDRGITNLHVPNDVIIDASMPVVIRDGGRMWGPDGCLQDCIAMIPDRSYATMYQEVIEDCQRLGAFDPATMGSVANVGLMAQKAEEYGSHDKTFEAPGAGVIKVVDVSGKTLTSQPVETGDLFRMCQSKDAPIVDWVKLAVVRARVSDTSAIFWLDPERDHDAKLIEKVNRYLQDHDTAGLDIKILTPVEAMRVTLERIRRGEDTIAVTGNVLRDYLTDLFPILELGTSAKMLSIVPLMNGGALFETGAGGSAPKHVQQFVEQGHLRWDSLGEFCALVASFEHVARTSDNKTVKLFSVTLDQAIGKYLENRKSPSRKVGELDNRCSHFYLALYWAEALAAQDEDAGLKARFINVADSLSQNKSKILEEFISAEGKPVDIGGYYQPDLGLVSEVMRPSSTLNAIIDAL